VPRFAATAAGSHCEQRGRPLNSVVRCQMSWPVHCAKCGSLFPSASSGEAALGKVLSRCPKCGETLREPVAPDTQYSPGRTFFRAVGLIFSVPEVWFVVFLILLAAGFFLK
jgi:NAD-dependent SIR2 family protein deacetylase